MQENICEDVDTALSQIELISITQQKVELEIGSDTFLDLILILKGSLVKSTIDLSGLNDALILGLNVVPQSVNNVAPKLNELIEIGEKQISRIEGNILKDCLGKTVISNYKIEIEQLKETLADITKRNSKRGSRLQSLFEQL